MLFPLPKKMTLLNIEYSWEEGWWIVQMIVLKWSVVNEESSAMLVVLILEKIGIDIPAFEKILKWWILAIGLHKYPEHDKTNRLAVESVDKTWMTLSAINESRPVLKLRPMKFILHNFLRWFVTEQKRGIWQQLTGECQSTSFTAWISHLKRMDSLIRTYQKFPSLLRSHQCGYSDTWASLDWPEPAYNFLSIRWSPNFTLRTRCVLYSSKLVAMPFFDSGISTTLKRAWIFVAQISFIAISLLGCWDIPLLSVCQQIVPLVEHSLRRTLFPFQPAKLCKRLSNFYEIFIRFGRDKLMKPWCVHA